MKFLFFALITSLCYAERNTEPLPVGNFALPFSQLPSPLVSFGENILNQGQVQLYLFADTFIGNDNYFTDVIPSVLYGITNDLSLFLNVPFSPGNEYESSHSSGIEDVFAQLEYAFYSQTRSDWQNQATLVANVTFPTGSSSKNPPTGWGSNTFFVGGTFSHMRVDWLFFTSYGGIITTSKHGTKFGDEFLYQLGIGRNIPSPAGWVFAWMVEFDGTYFWKDRIHHATDFNSGGNVIYLTPSFWASSKRFLVQFGVGYPIVQHLFGNQLTEFLSLDLNMAYTF